MLVFIAIWLINHDYLSDYVIEQEKVVEIMIKRCMICVCLGFCMFVVLTVFSFFRLSR
jgi:hypothetical protein